mgnify:CR=1 FL=1
MKDSKRYAYVEVSNEEYPRVKLSRTKDVSGEVFGPFISAEKIFLIKDLI